MVKHLLSSIFFIVIAFTACETGQPGNKSEVIATELEGLATDKDATPIVTDVMSSLKDHSTLVIPPGEYHFYPDQGTGRYLVISNNDNGQCRVLFDLSKKKNITIDGQGAEFVFHGHMVPFNIEDSENITIQNLSIDWDRAFHSEATVVANDPVNETFDISISENFPYRIEGDRLIWIDEVNDDPWQKDGWRQDISINIFFDPETSATVYRVRDYKMNPYFPLLHTQYSARELEPGLVRVTDSIAKLPEPGWKWVCKGDLEKNRRSPAIRIFGSKDVHLQNVDIHHAGAMGIIGERSEDISLNSVNVVLPPGKDRIVTTTADATHFVNCKGHISIDSCLFENMLDDATNIHGTYLKLVRHEGENTIIAHAVHDQQNVMRWAEAGDSIIIRNNKTMEPYVTTKLVSFTPINERYAQMEFEDDVSELPLESGLENPRWNPSFEMTNSTVRNNRARSILLSSNKEMLVENNRFERSMMAAIAIAGDMNFWFESGNVTDLVIRNNHFIDHCSGGSEQAVITFEPMILEPGERAKPFHRNVLVENNLFETFDHAIVEGYSVDGFTFRNNTVRQTNTFEPLWPEKAALNFSFSENIQISENKFEFLDDYQILHVDEASEDEVVMKNNN